jgi:hypothetical protein
MIPTDRSNKKSASFKSVVKMGTHTFRRYTGYLLYRISIIFDLQRILLANPYLASAGRPPPASCRHFAPLLDVEAPIGQEDGLLTALAGRQRKNKE